MSSREDISADFQRNLRKAKRLQLLSLTFTMSAVLAVVSVMGSSQAMRAAWFEDILALLPPLAFLIARRLIRRGSDTEHPYGWHRSVDVAHLAASLALLVMGAFIIYESLTALLTAEHPTIGTLNVFGYTFWQGWAMLVVLVYTAVPNLLIGRAKERLALALHDRVLYADARMNRDDWLTASGAMIGVVGIGFGVWWLDSAVATAIGFAVLRDGVHNVRNAVKSLTDVSARTTDVSAPHPAIAQINRALGQLSWVRESGCRVRELGHVLHVEAFVTFVGAVTETQLVEARHCVESLNPVLAEVVIVPVAELPDALTTRQATADPSQQ